MISNSYNILLFGLFLVFSNAEDLIVSLSDGQINGTYMNSWLNNQFLAFRRIPYAEPPIEDLRFQVSLLLLSNYF